MRPSLTRAIHRAWRRAWLILPLALPACDAPSSGWQEAKRLLAPGGGIVAVLAERNSGTPTSLVHEVFVVLSDSAAEGAKPVAILSGATRNDSSYGAALHWAGPDTLRIEYLRAKHDTLLQREVAVGGRRVTIQLLAGKHDPLAPAGAMVQARR